MAINNNDPWNEAVDTLAKNEAQRSYFLPRIDVDLNKWGTAIPFLWMLAGERFGCPTFCGEGFDVHAPDRPACMHDDMLVTANPSPSTTVANSASPIEFRISLATGNVSTLGVGARGLAGKLDYQGPIQSISLELSWCPRGAYQRRHLERTGHPQVLLWC